MLCRSTYFSPVSLASSGYIAATCLIETTASSLRDIVTNVAAKAKKPLFRALQTGLASK